MNRTAFFAGCAYAVLIILFKLTILLGGYTLTKFGFYYSQLVGIILIIPFYYYVVKKVRDGSYEGIISGKEAVRLTLTVFAVSTIIISIYNYIEFDWKYRDIAITYYNSDSYLNILREQALQHPDKLKEADFPRIIKEQLDSLSAFKATTGKLIPMMLFGLGGAFVVSILMKSSTRNV
jgi:hypothetical protein